ncbi:unnamed protein product, partial [Mesorhabditis belari]|uniref:Uncharacterized protein n=1 Tax=Mesorhabditis belari TaxID=2138241 RepID=A0AAF3FDP4_9BILA
MLRLPVFALLAATALAQYQQSYQPQAPIQQPYFPQQAQQQFQPQPIPQQAPQGYQESAPQQGPQGFPQAQGQQQQGPLIGYLLTPVAAPPEFVNNPADIPPMSEGQFTRMGGKDEHPLYVIQNPDTTGSASVLPPGYSGQPAESGQKPNGFFMPVGNAPLIDGRPFTLMVVNGMRTHGPAYNALPVQPDVSVKSEVVGYQAPAAPNAGGYAQRH